MSTESMHEFLARVDVFCNFSESELNTIVRITNRRQVKSGDFLCFEGYSGDSMFIVRDGASFVLSAKRRPVQTLFLRVFHPATSLVKCLLSTKSRAPLRSKLKVTLWCMKSGAKLSRISKTPWTRRHTSFCARFPVCSAGASAMLINRFTDTSRTRILFLSQKWRAALSK